MVVVRTRTKLGAARRLLVGVEGSTQRRELVA